MNPLKKKITALTFLILVGIPIINIIVDLNYFFSSSSIKDKTLLNFLKERFVPLFFLYPDIVFGLNDLIFNSIDFLKLDRIFSYIILPVLGLSGIYKFNKYGSLSIIYALLITQFFSALFSLFEITLEYIYTLNFSIALIVLYYLTRDLIVFIAGFYLIQYLKKESIRSFSIKDGFALQDKWKRFLNSLYDAVFIYYITYELSNSFGIFFNYAHLTLSQYFILFWSIFLFVKFVYYSISEGLLKTTIGKILTNSAIIEYNQRLISFRTALFRTLCRLIPFQSLTFLFLKKGLHDSLSNTEVIKNTKK